MKATAPIWEMMSSTFYQSLPVICSIIKSFIFFSGNSHYAKICESSCVSSFFRTHSDLDVDVDAEEDGKDAEEVVDDREGGIALVKPNEAVLKENRVTTKYMTKYERARILGTRALQISHGASIMVDPEGETDPLMIARKELRQRKIPIVVRRYLPDNSFEDWSIDDLIID